MSNNLKRIFLFLPLLSIHRQQRQKTTTTRNLNKTLIISGTSYFMN